MFRDRTVGITIIALLLTSLACNAFAGRLEPLPPTPTVTAEFSLAPAAGEQESAATPAALSPVAIARVTALVDLNVRNGPGVQYDRVGFLLENDTLPVLGVHASTGWWKIECPDNADGDACWVSGSEQNTRAEDITSVAEVAAPSTPTPIPPTLEDGVGLLAFIDDGMPFSAQLDLQQVPPQLASEPIQLADVDNVQSLTISPDGRRVAFVSATSEINTLFVVNIDGQDLRKLLSSPDLPLEVGQDNSNSVVLIDHIDWLPDSQLVAFNTIAKDLVRPAHVSQEDLWTVTIDGQLKQLFPSGKGGGAYAFTANNKVLLSRTDNIARADIDGTNEEIILRFEAINTASEAVFYPRPQPAAEGNAYTFIPAAQPEQPKAWTTLWHIPALGQARQLGVLTGVSLFDPIQWSPEGSHIAFLQQSVEQDLASMSRVMIADEKGIDADPYAGGDGLDFHAWSSDGTKFIYSGDGFYAVGRLNAPPVQTILNASQQVGGAQWVSAETFIAAAGFPENKLWELRSSTVAGENITLISLHSAEPKFDIWRP
mgnify:CR=1 FL=1